MNAKVQKYQHLINKKWYVQTFNATPVLINLGAMSGIYLMPKVLGYGYEAFIKDFKSGLCEMYYDRGSLHTVAHAFEERLHRDPKYMDKLIAMSAKNRDDMLAFIAKNIPLLKKFSDAELLAKYKEMAWKYYWLLSAWHLLEGYTLTRDKKLKSLLMRDLEKKGMGKKFNEYFALLTNPIRMPFITAYNNALANALNEIRKDSALYKKLNKLPANGFLKQCNKKIMGLLAGLEKDFFWVKANYNIAKRLTAVDFVEELKRVAGEKKQLEIVPAGVFEKNLAEKKRLIARLGLSDELVEVITATDFMSWWQDDRKKYTLQGCCALDDFMRELGSRFGISLGHMRYWEPDEITLEKLKTIKKNFFEDRVNGSFYIFEKGVFEVLTGKDYIEFRKAVKNKEDGEEIKEIMGISASVGKATGKVHICKTLKDIRDFRKGEVLVTGMTRPEFAPAMSRAAAIVTDEGGITSHAAVISRELGIPCIIGTKVATKTLNNGDVVEVNANHGTVKLLEAAKR